MLALSGQFQGEGIPDLVDTLAVGGESLAVCCLQVQRRQIRRRVLLIGAHHRRAAALPAEDGEAAVDPVGIHMEGAAQFVGKGVGSHLVSADCLGIRRSGRGIVGNGGNGSVGKEEGILHRARIGADHKADAILRAGDRAGEIGISQRAVRIQGTHQTAQGGVGIAAGIGPDASRGVAVFNDAVGIAGNETGMQCGIIRRGIVLELRRNSAAADAAAFLRSAGDGAQTDRTIGGAVVRDTALKSAVFHSSRKRADNAAQVTAAGNVAHYHKIFDGSICVH